MREIFSHAVPLKEGGHADMMLGGDFEDTLTIDKPEPERSRRVGLVERFNRRFTRWPLTKPS